MIYYQTPHFVSNSLCNGHSTLYRHQYPLRSYRNILLAY